MRNNTCNVMTSILLLTMILLTAACKGPNFPGQNTASSSMASSNQQPATSNAAMQQCSKDTDCKGERICDNGQCMAPIAFDATPEPEEQADPYACQAHENLLFHCLATNDKLITLCDAGSTLRYTFGKLGGDDPEMNLVIARSSASTSQGAAAQTIDLPYGNTTYSVFWGVDRTSDAHEIEAGVLVQVNDHHVATVQCKEDTVQNFMEDLDLKPAS